MNERGLRYDIVTSTVTTFVALLVAVLMWVASGMTDLPEKAGGLAATVIVAYMLLELNNRNALLRIRSRFISSVFLLLMGGLTFYHDFSLGYIPMICWAAAYFVFFMCYQNYCSQGYIFHVFLFLSLGAMVFPKMLLLGPFFLFSTIVQMRAFTLKVFAAALLGTAFPLALREAYLIMYRQNTALYGFWAELTTFSLPDYNVLDEHRLVSFSVVAIMAVAASIHFARTKFNDKIRTRMLYYVFLIEELAVLALLVACPDGFDVLFRLFVLNSAPLIAHHLAFAGGKAGNIYFYFTALLVLLLAVYNITGIELGIWEILRSF